MSQAVDIDPTNRDPNNLNDHLKVSWEEVFGEPESTRSIECVWISSYKCFECSKNCCYKLLTTLCGICIAFTWGCDFAAVAFNHVWCYTPCMRDFATCAGCIQKIFGTIVNCCCAPVCETCALLFSKVKVTRS